MSSKRVVDPKVVAPADLRVRNAVRKLLQEGGGAAAVNGSDRRVYREPPRPSSQLTTTVRGTEAWFGMLSRNRWSSLVATYVVSMSGRICDRNSRADVPISIDGSVRTGTAVKSPPPSK